MKSFLLRKVSINKDAESYELNSDTGHKHPSSQLGAAIGIVPLQVAREKTIASFKPSPLANDIGALSALLVR